MSADPTPPTVPSVRHARDLLAQLAATAGLLGSDRESDAERSPAAQGIQPASGASGVGEGFTPFYPDARTWVTRHYTVMYVRRLRNGQRWCAHWYDHPEALMRFEALWRTWEQARLTETIGTSTWLRLELDHHLPILHADDGPFAGCVDGEHRLPAPAMYPVADSDLVDDQLPALAPTGVL